MTKWISDKKNKYMIFLSIIVILLLTYGIEYKYFQHDIKRTVLFLIVTLFIFAINVWLIYLSKNLSLFDEDHEEIIYKRNYMFCQKIIVIISLVSCYVLNVLSGVSDTFFLANSFGIIIAGDFAQAINYYLRKENQKSMKFAIGSVLSILLVLSLALTVYSIIEFN